MVEMRKKMLFKMDKIYGVKRVGCEDLYQEMKDKVWKQQRELLEQNKANKESKRREEHL